MQLLITKQAEMSWNMFYRSNEVPALALLLTDQQQLPYLQYGTLGIREENFSFLPL